MPAHVTVLYPFAPLGAYGPALRAPLAEVVAGCPPFDFALSGLGSFPGVLYLTPEPAAPFVRLTEAISARLGYPPYGGRFAEIVPHLTVAAGHRLPRRLRRSLEASLPIAAVATEVEVLADRQGGWARLDAVPLGGGPARPGAA